ncbi:MAG: phosphoenolpyruvate carboxykinase (ATP), partial [Anaerolineales bacterium]
TFQEDFRLSASRSNETGKPPASGEDHGLNSAKAVHWTLPSPRLVEHIVQRGEGHLVHHGAVAVRTGEHTGRSPHDKFIVRQAESQDQIWWGKINQPIDEDHFEAVYRDVVEYIAGREIFVQDMAVGADPAYRLPIRVVSELAWHNLFARNLFLRIPPGEIPSGGPRFTIFHLPGFRARPEVHGTRSPVFILLNYRRRLVLIGGTSYAGEVKKSVFTVMNYLMPQQRVMALHGAANVGAADDVALFFGLSGTGKTTLSTTPERRLIGDDEHGWGDHGVFNFEGGCYAKAIHLREEQEPIIWRAIHHFGTVLENVVFDPESRRVDFDDGSLTENTRGAYPITYVENHVPSGMAGHPQHIFFLSADAFGVLPPIARLTSAQAMYYFLSGYTSKLGGTEKGLGAQPEATFSACFGAPFLPLHPKVYAELLKEKTQQHTVRVWLVNTGWSGGAYGLGKRMPLAYTRALIRAALAGALDTVPTRRDPWFGFEVPRQCPDVPEELLDPRRTWPDGDAYDLQARLLAERFVANFQAYESAVQAEVRQAGPNPSASAA